MVWDFLYLVWMERRRRRHRHQKDQVKNKRIIKHWNEPANERTNESALLLLARCWIAFRLIAAAAVANLKRKKNKIKGPAGIDKGNQRGGSVYRPFCCAWWVGSVGRSPAQTNERQNQLWWWHIHTHTQNEEKRDRIGGTKLLLPTAIQCHCQCHPSVSNELVLFTVGSVGVSVWYLTRSVARSVRRSIVGRLSPFNTVL